MSLMATARTLRSRLARLRAGDARQQQGDARQQQGDARLEPWSSALAASTSSRDASCNICGWHGAEFGGSYHSESAVCPSCNSIARDRYLYWCWTHRTGYERNARVLETSPRLDERYRSWHARAGALPGQRLRRVGAQGRGQAGHPEHRPARRQPRRDPYPARARARAGHREEPGRDRPGARARWLGVHRDPAAAGGHVAATRRRVPRRQHAGLLAVRLGPRAPRWRPLGCGTATLVTADLDRRVRAGDIDSNYGGDDCDEVDVLSHAEPDTWTVVADSAEARRYGFLPDFMFVCWHGVKPA